MANDPPVSERDMAIFQRMATVYHYRLLGAWETIFPEESIPPGCEEPPCIASWPLSKIEKMLKNFRNHLRLFPRNTPAIVGRWQTMAEDDLMAFSMFLLGCLWLKQESGANAARQDVEDALETLDESLGRNGRFWCEDPTWDKNRFAPKKRGRCCLPDISSLQRLWPGNFSHNRT
ncbi:hypothetical protein EDC01DRAFT_413607 [Geopyxis carbonaria]|nr:hypothetical protein EDC01DRAFT_413607 [Geopyxis carbonaria]